MPNWDKDIRRSLPEYRGREGDVVYNAPYRATRADLNAFALYADTTALQSLIDTELNECVEVPALIGSQRGLRFSTVEPWVVFIYAAFRSFASTDETDRREGRDQAFELSIWVPIVKDQVVSGLVRSELAWFLPIVYTSPTASVATGREVYGYPKVPAYLELPEEGGPPVAVQLREEVQRNAAGGKGKSPRLFSVPGDESPAKLGWNIDLNRNPELATIVNRFLANHPIVFRKQVGMFEKHSGPDGSAPRTVAGYTALIESRVPVTRLNSLNSIDQAGDIGWRLGGFDPELAKRLGLKSLAPQFGVALRDCRLDIQHGREIWVSSEHRDFIRPLPAPGNNLIWSPQVLRKREAANVDERAARAVVDPAVDTVEGVAEAYFGRTRQCAIESLLDRHFPDHLEGRPTRDPDRDFVMFLFVRADADADPAVVQLYELSVWVPVIHEESPAWYSPYVFRSPGAAVIQARQRYGHPCQEGFIEFDHGSPTRTVVVRLPRSLGRRGVEWARKDAIKFEHCAHKDDSAEVISDELARAALATGIKQHVVGLLQFRHAADTTRACLQETLRSERELRAADAPRDTGHWKATLPGELRFGRLLDLTGNTQVVRGYRFDHVGIDTSAWTLRGKNHYGIRG